MERAVDKSYTVFDDVYIEMNSENVTKCMVIIIYSMRKTLLYHPYVDEESTLLRR